MTSPVLGDIYSLDLHGNPDIQTLVDAGYPWCGLGLKATEGTYYPQDPSWFQKFWPLTKSIAIKANRYGQDFFRYAYHYFRVDEDAIRQAELFLGLIDSAGGWDIGDLRAMVDVETAEQPSGISNQQIIDGVTTFARHIAERTGRAPIGYWGSYIRDRKITDQMGCAYLVTAAYGSTLPSYLYTDMGWPLEKLLGWQYMEAGTPTGPKGYPQVSPMGSIDLTAVTICNGATSDEQLEWLRSDCRC